MCMHRVIARRVSPGGKLALTGQPACDEPVVQLDRRGRQHRLAEGRLDLHQSVGILDSGGHHAARPAELDTGAD